MLLRLLRLLRLLLRRRWCFKFQRRSWRRLLGAAGVRPKFEAQEDEVQVRAEVAEDVLGAAEYGSVKVLIVASIAIFQRRNPCLTHTCRPVDGRAREGPHDLPR